MILRLLISFMFIASSAQAAISSNVPIRIAYVGGLTGANSQAAVKSLKAMKLAVAEANAAGGALGRKIEVLEYDNESSAVKNIPLFRKILADKVIAISGIHHSNDGLILAEYAEKHRVPLVVASATHPGITKNREFVVRVCFTDDRQGQALANLAFHKMKARRVVTVVDVSNSFTDYLAKAFDARLAELGGQVVKTFPIRANDNDFRQSIGEIKRQAGLDAVFVATSAMEAGYFTTQLVSAGVSVPLLGNDGWQNDNLEQVLKNLQNTAFDALFTVHWHVDFGTPKAKGFMRSFQQTYGERINSFDADPALTYDGTALLVEAVRKANSIDPREIIRAARQLHFEGVTGAIRIGPTGDPKKRVGILRISKGKLRALPEGGV